MLLPVACCWAFVADAQLQLVPDTASQCVFGGEARKINVVWRNVGDKAVDAEMRTRLYQTSSATTVLLGELPWKRLQVLAGQTVIESAVLNFPVVKAETRFLVQWLEGTNSIIGKTEVLVYPTNLLAELKLLAGENPPGVFDPNNQLKPLLKRLAVDFMDLENNGIENFSGKLAVIGPFSSKSQLRDGLANQIAALAKKGKAIVWILPPPDPRDELQPSFYAVPEGSGCVVVAQANMVSGLAENPRAQLNLLHFARLALCSEPPHLAQTTRQ
jgi:hypothetical protein